MGLEVLVTFLLGQKKALRVPLNRKLRIMGQFRILMPVKQQAKTRLTLLGWGDNSGPAYHKESIRELGEQGRVCMEPRGICWVSLVLLCPRTVVNEQLQYPDLTKARRRRV